MVEFNIQTQNEYTVTTTESVKDGVEYYTFSFDFGKKISPKPITLTWEEQDCHYYATYTPDLNENHRLRPNWGATILNSKIYNNLPYYALLSKTDECLLSVALSEVVLSTEISFGFVEETNGTLGKIVLFPSPCAPMNSFQVTVRVDRIRRPLALATSLAVTWWESLGYTTPYVPNDAFAPVYSSWYNFHQKLDQQALIDECKIAASLGMKTLILDDGWQTDDNSRGYAYCGDWEIATSKFPDFKGFVDDIHALGMNVMVWFPVPFIGPYTKNYAKYEGKYLYFNEVANAAVVDPRYQEVRNYITGTYADFIKKYGIDGLKLDFIDSFRFNGEFSYSPEMDCYSVEEGVLQLLKEIQAVTTSAKKDFLIEFRQSYVGPTIAQYSNILRVRDCPGDIYTNLEGGVKIRLLSKNIAVHSDMFTCNPNEPTDLFLMQFLYTFFLVPQFSFMLKDLPHEKLNALKYYLDFHEKNKDIIFNGELSVMGASRAVTRIDSSKDNEILTVLYHDRSVELANEQKRTVINATGSEGIVLCANGKKYAYQVKNVFGETVGDGEIFADECKKIPLKNAEICILTAIQGN